jgi:hypothetical protein
MALQGSGEISIGDIAAEFEDTAPHSMSEFYGAADGIPSSGAIAISDFYGASNIIPAPVGLIVPYTGASAPANWTDFSSANDKFIVGAGSSYTVGTTGGNSSVSISSSLGSAGAHNGPGTTGTIYYSYGTQSPTGNSSAGAHTHNVSTSTSALDAYKNFKLIKCTSAAQIPADAILFGVSSLSGLTNVETSTDRFLRASSSYGGTGGSASFSANASSGSAGSHNHGNTAIGAGSGPTSNSKPLSGQGGHSHNVSISGSLNTKRIYLSAWSKAASAFDLVAGGIAMWESGTPPSGWAICNGLSGTPDLRDYFVRIGNTGNHGTTGGDNNAPWSGSSDAFNSSHNHIDTGYPNSREGGAAPFQHGSYPWSHTHNMSGSASVVPPYYALYFIQYVG